jgi:hypothetical protein
VRCGVEWYDEKKTGQESMPPPGDSRTTVTLASRSLCTLSLHVGGGRHKCRFCADTPVAPTTASEGELGEEKAASPPESHLTARLPRRRRSLKKIATWRGGEGVEQRSILVGQGGV